jgi:hypothetical protein
MSDPPAVTVLTRKVGRSPVHHHPQLAPPTPAAPSSLAFDGVEAVEIVVPDRSCAMLLLDSAAPTFPAELAAGPGWIVRFQQPPTGGAWVTDLLALVEGWLASAPIPCAKVRRGERSYLIRGPLDAASISRL